MAENEGNMNFYQELSRYYDEIFSVSASEMTFLVDQFKEKQRILDIGCGTGNKTELFSLLGREIIGIDLDHEMIALAKKNHAINNIKYMALDMMLLDQHFKPGYFDGILCLGNTLAHLTSNEDLKLFIASCRKLLKAGGLIAIQVLNYDRIINNKVAELPVIETPKVIFKRRYNWRKGIMRFITNLEIKNSGKNYTNDISLYPFKKIELARAFNLAGFKLLNFYGGYDSSLYSMDSFITIIVARV